MSFVMAAKENLLCRTGIYHRIGEHSETEQRGKRTIPCHCSPFPDKQMAYRVWENEGGILHCCFTHPDLPSDRSGICKRKSRQTIQEARHILILATQLPPRSSLNTLLFKCTSLSEVLQTDSGLFPKLISLWPCQRNETDWSNAWWKQTRSLCKCLQSDWFRAISHCV